MPTGNQAEVVAVQVLVGPEDRPHPGRVMLAATALQAVLVVVAAVPGKLDRQGRAVMAAAVVMASAIRSADQLPTTVAAAVEITAYRAQTLVALVEAVPGGIVEVTAIRLRMALLILAVVVVVHGRELHIPVAMVGPAS